MRSPANRRLQLLGLALTLAVGCSPAKSTEPNDAWSQFRGNNSAGIAADAKLPTEWSEEKNLVWRSKEAGFGNSTPIVLGDKIYVTAYSGYNEPSGNRGSMDDLKLHLNCLDAKTGKRLWQSTVDAKLPEQDRIRDDHGYSTSTPITDGKLIYCFFGKTGVYAFTLEGKEVWNADVGDKLNGWGTASSLVLLDNMLIVNASIESESLYALDKKTGKELWRVRGIQESWNTPIVVKNSRGENEIVLAKHGAVLGISPKTGKELWNCATDIPWYMVPTLVADGDLILCIGGRTGGALAVRAGGSGDVTKTHREWVGKKGSNVSSPLIYEGHMYWMNDAQGIAYCADAKTGDIVYEERVSKIEQIYASPILAGGKIYYVSRTGNAVVVAAKPEFEIVGESSLRRVGIFNATPAIYGNNLLLRADRELFCFGEK